MNKSSYELSLRLVSKHRMMSDMDVSETSTSQNLSCPSSTSSVSCKFLGSLTSARGRDLLSQLCLQIAQKSKLRHHFVERKDIERIGRQLLPKASSRQCHSNSSQTANEDTTPFEMKVFFKRDQLERLVDEQVRILVVYR
jgi:hypothetical protein